MIMFGFLYKKSEVSVGVKRLNSKCCTPVMVPASLSRKKTSGGHDGKY